MEKKKQMPNLGILSKQKGAAAAATTPTRKERLENLRRALLAYKLYLENKKNEEEVLKEADELLKQGRAELYPRVNILLGQAKQFRANADAARGRYTPEQMAEGVGILYSSLIGQRFPTTLDEAIKIVEESIAKEKERIPAKPEERIPAKPEEKKEIAPEKINIYQQVGQLLYDAGIEPAFITTLKEAINPPIAIEERKKSASELIQNILTAIEEADKYIKDHFTKESLGLGMSPFWFRVGLGGVMGGAKAEGIKNKIAPRINDFRDKLQNILNSIGELKIREKRAVTPQEEKKEIGVILRDILKRVESAIVAAQEQKKSQKIINYLNKIKEGIKAAVSLLLLPAALSEIPKYDKTIAQKIASTLAELKRNNWIPNLEAYASFNPEVLLDKLFLLSIQKEGIVGHFGKYWKHFGTVLSELDRQISATSIEEISKETNAIITRLQPLLQIEEFLVPSIEEEEEKGEEEEEKEEKEEKKVLSKQQGEGNLSFRQEISQLLLDSVKKLDSLIAASKQQSAPPNEEIVPSIDEKVTL